MQLEMTPETLVRELIGTELHRQRLLAMLKEAVGAPIQHPGIFQEFALTILESRHPSEPIFGEGFNLTDSEVSTLLRNAIG